MTSLPVQLAETVKSMGVKAIYGDPVTVEGVTIIPVAIAWFGFGGGEDGKPGQVASGGGGGGATVPVGAYVKTDGTARFEPNLISLIAVSIPMVWVAGHALSRVIKALKK